MSTTPMMQQYHQAKKACGDALLLFRMGDFYELFFEDAKIAAKAVGLTLTSRDKGENPIPMAGFPYHQLETYLAKLIATGHRAAICEQVENPKQAKGLVRREVTRIVTRGTLMEDTLLAPETSNYLASVVPGEDAGLAWIDVSTGRFCAGAMPQHQVADQLARIEAVECLISDELEEPLPEYLQQLTLAKRPAWAFASGSAAETLAKHFGTASLEGFGFDPSTHPADLMAIRAAGAILDYLSETQKASLDHIDRLVPYRQDKLLQIDPASRRSLEITRTLREGRREGSLLGVMDRTVTAMGARLLGEWLAAPLVEKAPIDARLDAVGELRDQTQLSDALRRDLRNVYDVERLVARITTGRATPRDLGFLARTLASLPQLKEKLAGLESGLLQQLDLALDLCVDIREQLEAALVDECPLTSRDGGIIREGFDGELDELRDLTRGGKQWIAEYQAREMERTGIPNIRVGFNKVFGYYLEVTHAQADKVPDEYIRKQTIKSAERYITPELKEHEERVLDAEERAKELEHEVFVKLRAATAVEGRRLLRTAAVLARLDVLAALAELARERSYCRPEICEQPLLEIAAGRHPVLDILEPGGSFVPNDTYMGELAHAAGGGESKAQPVMPLPDGEHARVLIITGPNMAGKSTYIRQVALITLMAQVGSFVPAGRARVGIADRIFARVGASDELSRGQSTFMVEMTETARILNTATSRSLVILDEIGRGTSTYDGVSLAWSIVEHLHDAIGSRTLFATHYHELTDLAQSLQSVANLNVAVREWKDQVVFLHQIVPGAADKSYGIHVARLAGVPRVVNERAKDILALLEDEHLDGSGRPRVARHDASGGGTMQLTLFGMAEHPLLDRLRELDLESTTPIQALTLLAEWQTELRATGHRKPR